MDLLRELNGEGQTVLLVTHDPKLATRYSSRVVSLLDGRVVDDLELKESGLQPPDLVRVRVEGGVR